MQINQQTMIDELFLLFRVPVSLMVGLSAALGALLARPRLDGLCLGAALAAMLLAWGCSAWNQAQEFRVDALMERTARRPLASGRMSVLRGVLWGTGCVLIACVFFYEMGGMRLAGLGAGIALVYNGIYTPLKKRSGFALLAGAVVGATPPLTGWMAAGGKMGDPLLALIFGLYALWQIPHFWLRAERYVEEYQRAGLPLPNIVLAAEKRGRLLEIWFCAFAVTLLMAPAFPLFQATALRLTAALIGLSVFCAASLLFRLRKRLGPEKTTTPAIALADGSLLLIMFLLAADALLASALK